MWISLGSKLETALTNILNANARELHIPVVWALLDNHGHQFGHRAVHTFSTELAIRMVRVIVAIVNPEKVRRHAKA